MKFNFKKGDILRYTGGYHMIVEVLAWNGNVNRGFYAKVLEMDEFTEWNNGERKVGKMYYFNPPPFIKLNGIEKAVRRLRLYSVTSC